MARDVLVVGAGPVGLTMALDLTRRGVPCRIVDRLAEPLPYCRAIGVTPRTLEVWEAMDLSDAMIGSGLWLRGMRSVIAGGPAQDAVRPELPIPYAELGIPQYETEAILTRRLMLHGVMPERGMALTALSQDAGGVAVTLSGKAGVEEARFAYVIGCDGAHSTVRHQVGVGFTGDAFPWPFMLGDVHIAWDLPYGMALRALRLHEDGPPDMFIAIPLPEPGATASPCPHHRRSSRRAERTTAYRRICPARRCPICKPSRTTFCRENPRYRILGGLPSSGSASGLRTATASGASSWQAMPRISTRPRAARA